MDLAGQKTPPGSLIWAWWDHGYPIHYWSRRGTISDGAYHDGEVAMINAFAMVSPDYRLSANWMHFYAARGIDGFHRVYKELGGAAEGLDLIREVLVAGPEGARGIIANRGLKPQEQWLQFFYPPLEQRRKVYLFLDERLVGTSYWWYWLGSWDVRELDGDRPVMSFFVQVRQEGDRVQGKPPFTIDLAQGIFSAAKTVMPLAMVVSRQNDQWMASEYRDVGMIFEHDPTAGWGALCSPEIYESVFNKLFFLGMADIRFFKPVLMTTGIYQLWEVLGDLPVSPASSSP
jgi:dolichyl-diphosphooligosaccharide--protein glycosyltransferase